MSDLVREFEMQIWAESISFGKMPGESVLLNSLNAFNYSDCCIKVNGEKKGVNHAIVGRIDKRTPASSK